MFCEEILYWRFGKETSQTYIQEIPFVLTPEQLTYPSAKPAVLQRDGFACLLLSDPRSSHTCRSFVSEMKPQQRPSFQPTPLLTHHGEKFNASNTSPSPLSPKPACNTQDPTGDVRIFGIFAKTESCRKGGPLLGPHRGTVCSLLTATTIFICFSKLSLINTRRLWLMAERAHRADSGRVFRLLR